MAPFTQTAINKLKISLLANSDHLNLTTSTLMNVQFLLLPSIQAIINSRALNSEIEIYSLPPKNTNHKPDAGLEHCEVLSKNGKQHVIRLNCIAIT